MEASQLLLDALHRLHGFADQFGNTEGAIACATMIEAIQSGKKV